MRVRSTDRDSLKRLWEDPQMLALPLVILFLDNYGFNDRGEWDPDDCLEWDPATVYRELMDDFQVRPPDGPFERLLAARVIISTDRFYRNLEDFISLCNVLSGSRLEPDHWDPADATECAWGITEAVLLHPPEEEDPFSPEITGYIGKVCEREGILWPPDVLRLGLVGNPTTPEQVAHRLNDPELVADVLASQNTRSQAVTQIVKARLQLLVSQLQSLPLLHGNTDDVVKKVLKLMPPT